MRPVTCLIIAYVLMLCRPALLNATDYRVSSAAHIIAAMSKARPGDTLTMSNGSWVDAAIVFAGYGTETAPILLRAESYGGVVLTGFSTVSISGKHLVVDGLLFQNGYSPSGPVISFKGSVKSDSCRLTNCAVVSYNSPDRATDIDWVSLYGSHNRVDHCYFRGKTNKGTVIVVWCDTAKSDYHQIDHNYFGPRPPYNDDPTNPTSYANGFETIRVGTGAVSATNSFTVVEYNYFYKCDGDAECISNKANGNTYRYNTLVSCQGQLSMRQGNGCTIEGNFILGNHAAGYRGTSGIRLTGTDHRVFNNYVSGIDNNKAGSALALMDGTAAGVTPNYPQARRAIVVFNTFVDNTYSVGLGINTNNGTLPPDSCIIANNVVYTTISKPLVTVMDPLTSVIWSGNIFFGGSTLGITQPAGISIVDPRLALAPDLLWRPGATSPVTDAATSANAFPFVTADVDGQPRDSSSDVGADELSTAAITRRPLTPADVGPPPAMITSIEVTNERRNVLPGNLVLEQNFPNPFNPTTTITYALPAAGQIELEIFDVLGRRTTTLAKGHSDPGTHTAVWDASGVPSGIYFCQLRSGGRVITKKLTVVR